MKSKKQNPLRTIGRQIQSIMPVLQAQEPLSGAKIIGSLDSVPELYQDFFKPLLSRGQEFPYTVITPSYEVSGETITGKLVCAVDHTFYVLEETESGMTKVCYPIDEINYVEVLHRQSELRIIVNGATNLGLPATSVFGCDNTTDHLFTPLFQRIRLRIVALNEKAPSRRTDKLDRWNDLNTHVIDMARHCLMAGETVLEAILQPEIRPSLFSADRAFRGPKCATHICILTDKELVMIREDLSLGKKDKCGSVCNFIPLNKINSFSTTRENGKVLVVSTRLSNGDVFESLFDISLEHEVDRFLARTRELMPKERWYVRD